MRSLHRAITAFGLVVAVTGCTATSKGIRTAGAPEPPGERVVKVELRNVDPNTAGFWFGPAEALGRPVSALPPSAAPMKPAAMPTNEIPAWLIKAADDGDTKAQAQLAAWMLERQRRKP